MQIQAAIDALPPIGGLVNIPTGDWSAQPKLRLRDNVRLVGEGMGTLIPPILDGAGRRYGMALEHLIVDGSHNPGYGIDWRGVTQGRIVNVISRNVTYGLLMFGDCYYNHVEQLFIDASICAAEITSLANQNTFVNGRWTAPLCLRLANNNLNTFDTVSLEGPPGTVHLQRSGDTNTRAINVRKEITGGTATAWNE